MGTATKKQIRDEVLIRLRGLSASEREDHSAQVAERFLGEWDRLSLSDGKVALFRSLPWEIDLEPLISGLLQRRVSLLFPRVQKKDGPLDFFEIDPRDEDRWETSSWGLLEPKKTNPLTPLSSAQLVVTPALAVSLSGYRIGYGKGHYDRTFAGMTIARWSVMYDFQDFPTDWEADAWDIPVDRVITPSHIRYCSRPASLPNV